MHRSLFLDSIITNKIGVCRWMEAGTTIDTALPGIKELTDDKPEWRAIIVRLEDGSEMKKFQSKNNNPYDFADQDEKNFQAEETEVPLVRLAQMLGGVPSIPIEFESHVITGKGLVSRTVYKPVVDERKMECRNNLVEKYKFGGNLPSEVMIISIRATGDEEPQPVFGTNAALGSNYKDADFCKRNAYPDLCRFLVFDIINKGTVRKNADMFRFWTSVLLLGTNRIPSSTLRAYKLFNIDVAFDKFAMEQTMQQTVDRMVSTGVFIDNAVKRITEHSDESDDKIPDYKVTIPVILNFDFEEYKKQDEKVRLSWISKNQSDDAYEWNQVCKEKESEIRKAINQVQRVNDGAADKCRKFRSYSKLRAKALNKYQKQDLNTSMHETYRGIIEERGCLNSNFEGNKEETDRLKLKVFRQFLEKPTFRQLFFAVFTCAFVILLQSTNALVFLANGENSNVLSIINISLASLGIAFLGMVIALIVYKSKMKSTIKSYNTAMESELRSKYDNADVFSHFVSSIASYFVGKTYLKELDGRSDYKDDYMETLGLQQRAAEKLKSNITTWKKAFFLDVNLQGNVVEDNVGLNLKINPTFNPHYTLDDDIMHEIALNNTGDKIYSRLPFIKTLTIEGEELRNDC